MLFRTGFVSQLGVSGHSDCHHIHRSGETVVGGQSVRRGAELAVARVRTVRRPTDCSLHVVGLDRVIAVMRRCVASRFRRRVQGRPPTGSVARVRLRAGKYANQLPRVGSPEPGCPRAWRGACSDSLPIIDGGQAREFSSGRQREQHCGGRRYPQFLGNGVAGDPGILPDDCLGTLSRFPGIPVEAFGEVGPLLQSIPDLLDEMTGAQRRRFGSPCDERPLWMAKWGELDAVLGC
jgi:hypothetical protein